MWRIEVSDEGQPALPPIDVADDTFAIGSGEDARVRLPAEVARDEHVRIERGVWRALGAVREPDGDEGPIGDGVTLTIGRYRVRIAPAPPGAPATVPQRTESLARELARSLLGTDGAPTLEIVRGPVIGERRMLAPPESVLVIGRGDEAGWAIVDEDLSRAHVEVRRSWDGIRVVDLGSKNGTRIDGAEVPPGGALVRDGAQIELGKVLLRFADPAEQHLRARTATGLARQTRPVVEPIAQEAPRPSSPPRARRPSVVPFYAALGVMLAAVAGLVWILVLSAT